jgi:hypothetical protein
MVEIDLTDLDDGSDAALRSFVDELVAAGMTPTPLPKYALGHRLLWP